MDQISVVRTVAKIMQKDWVEKILVSIYITLSYLVEHQIVVK